MLLITNAVVFRSQRCAQNQSEYSFFLLIVGTVYVVDESLFVAGKALHQAGESFHPAVLQLFQVG